MATRAKAEENVYPPYSHTIDQGPYGIGAVAIGAAAAGKAYYRREDFSNGWKWGNEHMTFVRDLWDADEMRGRLLDLDGLGKENGLEIWK